MKYTREQFDSIGQFYLDDFPVDSYNQDLMFEIFNRLPEGIQSDAICWGFSDSVFRDNCFEFLLKKLLNMTPEEYYRSEIAKEYFVHYSYIEIDLDKIGRKLE